MRHKLYVYVVLQVAHTLGHAQCRVVIALARMVDGFDQVGGFAGLIRHGEAGGDSEYPFNVVATETLKA